MSRRSKKQRDEANPNNVSDEEDTDQCECEGGDISNFGCFMLVVLLCFTIGGCWTHQYFEKRAVEQHQVEMIRLELEKQKLEKGK